MLTRRSLAAAALLATTIAVHAPAVRADTADAATSFIESTAKRLQDVVNGDAAVAQKQAELQQIIDQSVDVSDVARFCLGRFWRTATPEQQRDYLDLFHRVLMFNITSKVSDYQGVSFTMGRSAVREGDIAVSTTVVRPGNAPNRVDWIVSTASGSPKIIDIVAEGTSLRLTQRSDYASYLSRNNNNVQALIDAMKQQVAGAQ
jgi:phospholipid transport system substrate-binding protein